MTLVGLLHEPFDTRRSTHATQGLGNTAGENKNTIGHQRGRRLMFSPETGQQSLEPEAGPIRCEALRRSAAVMSSAPAARGGRGPLAIGSSAGTIAFRVLAIAPMAYVIWSGPLHF